MGFLLWQPQLLSELWDRVSSENNQRPLKKKITQNLATGRSKALRGGKGEVGVGQTLTKPKHFPIAPLRRAAQLDNG